MKIGPGPLSPPKMISPGTDGPRKATARGDSEQSPSQAAAAMRAEREAENRIYRATQTAIDAENQARQKIDESREQTTTRLEQENARSEALLTEHQEETDKALRKTQQDQSRELGHIRREGEKRVTDLTNYYREAQAKIVRDSESAMRENIVKTETQLDFEKKNFAAESEKMKDENLRTLAALRENSDQRVQVTVDDSQRKYQEMREKQHNAQTEGEKKFNEEFGKIHQKQAQTLNATDQEISRRVDKLRADGAQKLAAYEDQQKDPFYRLVTIDAGIEETEQAYILRAEVPEHERKSINVSVRGDQIVVSGYRKSQEKQTLEPGRTQSSSNFHSFNETFPITWPVDVRGLKREMDGDILVVTIPKKLTYQPYKSFKANHAEGTKIEKPVFPNALPLEKFIEERLAFEKPVANEGEDQEPVKRLGDRTLNA